MAESTDQKPTIDQAAPLMASAVDQSLDDATSSAGEIEALLEEVESLEPAFGDAAAAKVEHLTEQARAIDQAARSTTPRAVAAPTAIAKPAAVNADATALKKADQALANDLDALLQGDFESIDAVLDGVFDEQAVLVQADEHAKAKTPRQLEIESAASRETDQVHQAQPTVRNAESFAALGTSNDTVREAMTAPIAAPIELPPSENLTSNSVPEPSPVSALAAVVAAHPQSDQSTSTRSLDAAAAITTAPASSAAPAQARRRIRIKIDSSGLARPLKAIAYQTLVLVNFPMKFVPVKLKPALDLVAMSLVLWVPLAFILPPKIAAWNAARAAAAHTTAAVHAESSNAGAASGQEAPADDHDGGH